MSEQTKWMVDCILTGRSERLPMADAEQAFREAARQGVATLLWERTKGITTAEWPDALGQLLKAHAYRTLLIELARGGECKKVVAALADAGQRLLLLKGGALAYWLYASPGSRSRGDLDILVDGRGAARTAISILKALGYTEAALELDAAPGYETALVRRDAGGVAHRIDLHWRIMDNARLARPFDFQRLWQESRALEALHSKARGLGHRHALIHALLHRVTNMPHGTQNRLIWLYDIHLLVAEQGRDDWEALAAVARRYRLAWPLLDGLQAAGAMFKCGIPSDIERELRALAAREDWPAAGTLGSGHLDRMNVGAMRPLEAMHWLRYKLFPSAGFMRMRYGAKTPIDLGRWYLRRWWIGLRRGLRVDA